MDIFRVSCMHSSCLQIRVFLFRYILTDLGSHGYLKDVVIHLVSQRVASCRVVVCKIAIQRGNQPIFHFYMITHFVGVLLLEM